MISTFLKIALLTFACVSCIRANDDCKYNEYSSTRLVSDFSSVIVSVSSLQSCLTYLKNNKFTHKAVAYDARTRKCCSVLQELDYSLVNETGWTTFEVRDGGSSGILGLCPGRAVVLSEGQSVTLSVYSYETSICDLNNLTNYQNGPDCIGSVTSVTADLNFQYELNYRTEANFDFIRLRSAYQDLRYSGSSSTSGILHAPTIFLSWTTDTSGNNKGFCLTITATKTPPPTTAGPTTTSTTPRTIPGSTTTRTFNGTAASRGVCQFNSTYIPANGTATFSIYTEELDPCERLASLSYTNGMNCTHYLATDPGYALSYYITYNTETNYDFITITHNGQSNRFSGRGTFEEELSSSNALVNWLSDVSSTLNGFCLRVRSQISVPPTNASVQGVCTVQNILVVPYYTRSVSVYSYGYNDCSDLSALRSYAGNQFCISRLFVANNASDYEYEISYQTQNENDYLSMYNNVEELRFFGNGTRSGTIEGPIIQLHWSTDSALSGKGFCLKVRAIPPADGSGFSDEDQIDYN